MFTRYGIERIHEERLPPYAMRTALSRGRRHAEDESPYRGVFQRDRDRIVHSTAFRRMEYKTQVFVIFEGDHYRTRLTHSLEVMQIARTAARALGLNEDLVEVLALAHDLGHGPFGHSGEDALDEVMAGHGGFDHNLQGLRIVDLLEHRYPDFPGLNLAYESREGFTKNLTLDGRRAAGFAKGEWPTLEVRLVERADEIAYDTHDVEDGLVSGTLREEALREVALWRETEAEVRAEHAALAEDWRLRWRAVVRRLIAKSVGDLIAATEARLQRPPLPDLAAVRAAAGDLVCFSSTFAARKAELEDFLHRQFYSHPRVRTQTRQWQERLKALFLAFRAAPERLPEAHRQRVAAEHEPLERIICDYVAGMTDRFAEQEWRKVVAKGT